MLRNKIEKRVLFWCNILALAFPLFISWDVHKLLNLSRICVLANMYSDIVLLDGLWALSFFFGYIGRKWSMMMRIK
ncbi:unnamed protein product [Brassica oleracea]|uniref:(rape) hypothetical protein n=1 Tax=Brassica napus TaxID=3708 RepID=A0A816IJW8_BRANA|nr:unnamed protein product [Brassica napus]